MFDEVPQYIERLRGEGHAFVRAPQAVVHRVKLERGSNTFIPGQSVRHTQCVKMSIVQLYRFRGRQEWSKGAGLLCLGVLTAILSHFYPRPEGLERWSGRPGSNRRPTAWKAETLPLSYSRLIFSILAMLAAVSAIQAYSRVFCARNGHCGECFGRGADGIRTAQGIRSPARRRRREVIKWSCRFCGGGGRSVVCRWNTY